MMQERLAFTANFWGDSAVVCRAIEDRPGPVADQQFGQFQTWTQAQDFAARLNEGLELAPAEARQIVTSSILEASELLRGLASPEVPCHGVPASAWGKLVHIQFALAELDLAITFCRIARSKPGALADRMRGNARTALFNAMHFVCRPELTDCEVEEVTARMQKLYAAFQESLSQRQDSIVAAGQVWASSSENSSDTPDSEEIIVE